jgi:hypothetical protein
MRLLRLATACLGALALCACGGGLRHPVDLPSDSTTGSAAVQRFRLENELRVQVGAPGYLIYVSLPAGEYVPVMRDCRGYFYTQGGFWDAEGVFVDFAHHRAWSWYWECYDQEIFEACLKDHEDHPDQQAADGMTFAGIPGAYGIVLDHDITEVFFASARWETASGAPSAK